ncbi:uncharacterized protein CLUP02_13382 [Colletotrichum lupini]|uniref:Uncharacterized protein n=1 Tax=Colletotrichum lupini TaxID=145971 RepID=A0A9Q8WLN5_9PEZI|nr:uncharacterized protein CLUP02_13382 [Colletotrichum lupini]UQC87861.1 hypothetical protein CLUP02_13382 [Colletotrichum lupini]
MFAVSRVENHHSLLPNTENLQYSSLYQFSTYGTIPEWQSERYTFGGTAHLLTHGHSLSRLSKYSTRHTALIIVRTHYTCMQVTQLTETSADLRYRSAWTTYHAHMLLEASYWMSLLAHDDIIKKDYTEDKQLILHYHEWKYQYFSFSTSTGSVVIIITACDLVSKYTSAVIKTQAVISSIWYFFRSHTSLTRTYSHYVGSISSLLLDKHSAPGKFTSHHYEANYFCHLLFHGSSSVSHSVEARMRRATRRTLRYGRPDQVRI